MDTIRPYFPLHVHYWLWVVALLHGPLHIELGTKRAKTLLSRHFKELKPSAVIRGPKVALSGGRTVVL